MSKSVSYFEAIKPLKEASQELKVLFEEAFNQRSLPEFWRVGQKVRYLRDSEWAWSIGSIGYVVELRPEYKNTPANEYQVFYTAIGEKRFGIFWTTPEDVELVVEEGTT
jgi:hypothetical protein